MFVLGVLIGCIFAPEKKEAESPQSVRDVANIKNTNRIAATNGSNGNMVEITEASDIETILEFTEKIMVTKEEEDPSGGYSYALAFYEGEEELATIIFCGVGWMDIDGDDYRIREDNSGITIESLMEEYYDR